MKRIFPYRKSADFPKKSITMIVPTGAGVEDTEARGIAPYVQKYLRVKVLVENQVGAWGRIAFEKFQKMEPDGYHLIAYTFPRSIIVEHMYMTGFRTKDFTPVFAWSLGNPLLVVPTATYETFHEFLSSARVRTLSGALPVRAGISHLFGILLANELGINVDWVPYEGSALCMAALARKDIDFTICLPTALPSWIKKGKIRPLIILSDKRDAYFPEIPTTKELGYDISFISARRGVQAPPHTPPDIVMVLEEAFSKAVKDPAYMEWAKRNHVFIDPLRAQEFSRVVAEAYLEIEKFKEMLKA